MAGNREAVAEQITAVAERVGAPQGIEIVEVQVLGGGKARLVRITIDKVSGVTHGDCELVSREVGGILDSEDIVPGESYHLEVTSPGIERKLSKPRDFERFSGQKARVVLREPVEGQKRWDGVLAGFADGVVTLEPAPGRQVRFTLDQLDKANLKHEW